MHAFGLSDSAKRGDGLNQAECATMKVLLVWPEIPITYWGGQYAVKLMSRLALMPPLGLLTVAALLPKDWTLRLIDLNIQQIRPTDIDGADLVLVSGMAIQHKSMMEVINMCRRARVPSVVGGPHATSSPEKFADAAHLVLDEGEITLPLFLSDYQAGNPHRIYTARGEKPDITQSPVPRFDLLSSGAYAEMCIQFSRGCPFACEFCDITTLYGKKPRTKTPKQMVRELQTIYDLGFRGEVFLVDDNFIGNKKNVKLMIVELIAWMEQNDYPFRLFTEASLNLADEDELLELMAKAGFFSVFVGIETPSLESLRETRKYQNLHGDMLSKIHKIQQYGIEVTAGFIVGFDHDTKDIFDRQIEFITAARIPMAMVGPLNAMPNTQLWERLKKEVRLKADFDGDNLGFCNFETAMPALDLVRGYRAVLVALYSPANFFARLKDLISSQKGSCNETRGRLTPSKVRAFAPLLEGFLRLSTISDHAFRKEYWRFMLWVFCRRPDRFLFALCRAIVGFHFIRYTAEVMVPRLSTLETELMSNT